MTVLAEIRTFLRAMAMPVRVAYLRHVWGYRIGRGSIVSFQANLDRTAPASIIIGDYADIGVQCMIMSHDSVNAEHKITRIGSNCLLGARSFIAPGVTIGNGAIVGLGSVVLADVPERCLVIGNPARVIERDLPTGKWGVRLDRVSEDFARRATPDGDGAR